MEPIKLKAGQKTGGRVFRQRDVSGDTAGKKIGDTSFKMFRKNPLTVIQEANQQLVKFAKKQGNKKSSHEFTLAINVGGDLHLGDSNKSSTLHDQANRLVSQMEEGKVYMLLPDSSGTLRPIWLRSSKLGETNDRGEIISALSDIMDNHEDSEKLISSIQKKLYQVKINQTEQGITVERNLSK